MMHLMYAGEFGPVWCCGQIMFGNEQKKISGHRRSKLWRFGRAERLLSGSEYDCMGYANRQANK